VNERLTQVYTFNREHFALCVSDWIGDRKTCEVAAEVGIHHATLYRYLGAQFMPNAQHFMTLCIAMNADPFEFGIYPAVRPSYSEGRKRDASEGGAS